MFNTERGIEKMKIQDESDEDVTIQLEKMCCDWNIYAKHIERPRPHWRLT